MYDGNGTNNCFTWRRDLDVPGRRLDVRRLRRRRTRSAPPCRARCSAGPARARSTAGTSIRTRPRPGTPRSRCSSDQARHRRARRRRAAGCGAGVDGATKKTVELGDNYYAPKTVTVSQGHDGHVALARLRGSRRRARRQAQERPEGRQEVPVRGGGRRTTRFKRKLTVAGHVQDRLHAPRGDDDDDQGAKVGHRPPSGRWPYERLRLRRRQRERQRLAVRAGAQRRRWRRSTA